MPPARDLASIYEPACKEVHRRQNVVAATDCDTVRHFTGTGATCRPLCVPEQRHVLVSMGTNVLAPRTLEQTAPLLRVYGAFATVEDARDHGTLITSTDPRCSLCVLRCGEWVLMPQDTATRDDAQANAARVEARLQAHRMQRAAADSDFERTVHERLQRPVPATEGPSDDEEECEIKEAEGLVYARPTRLRAGAEVRHQNSCVICCVPDPVGGECLIKVMGCFESTSEANDWCRNVASHTVTRDDLLVAPTCEWLTPNAPYRKSQRCNYRHGEQQRIMDAALDNPAAVKKFREWQKEQDALGPPPASAP